MLLTFERSEEKGQAVMKLCLKLPLNHDTGSTIICISPRHRTLAEPSSRSTNDHSSIARGCSHGELLGVSYPSSRLLRTPSPDCGEVSLGRDGRLSCCNTEVRGSDEGSKRRKSPLEMGTKLGFWTFRQGHESVDAKNPALNFGVDSPTYITDGTTGVQRGNGRFSHERAGK